VSYEGAGNQRAAAENYARFLRSGGQGKPAEYSMNRLKAWVTPADSDVRSVATARAGGETLRLLARPDGVPIAYRRTAARRPAGKAPVLLLHGLASNMTRWSEFVERTRLAEERDVIRVDLRGHGDSPMSGRISLELWCDDLLALLDAEGASHAVLIGHSLGAQVALACAARAPGRIAALVLIDPVFRPALRGRWKWIARAAPLFVAAAAVVRGLNALGLRRQRIPPLDLRALDELARASLGSPQAEAEFIRRYSSNARRPAHVPHRALPAGTGRDVPAAGRAGVDRDADAGAAVHRRHLRRIAGHALDRLALPARRGAHDRLPSLAADGAAGRGAARHRDWCAAAP